jgi:signal transduction histidine kinase/ligand-binding sensor domain-containing protein/DNA-binding response OmpR family regulator
MNGIKYICYILFLFGIQACSNFIFAQKNDLIFHRLTLEDGLSNGDVNQIFQDKLGFIWICTDDGLNLYDGYSFKIYTYSAADTNSISNNSVSSIIEDKTGKLWVGTNNGLNVFDRSSQTFKRYFFNQKNLNSISNNDITNFCLDQNDRLWIGTDNGLNRYNPEKDNFTRYSVTEDLSLNVKGNTISALACDKQGYIWTSEYFNGLNRIDPETGKIKNYPIDPKGSLLKDIVISIYPNPNGNLWLGLLNGQILDFNSKTDKIKDFTIADNHNINNKVVGGIIHSGNVLWLIQGKSLVSLNLSNRKYQIYSNDPQNPKSLPNGTPQCITETKDGNIWIGIDGITSFNPKLEKFSEYYYLLPKETARIKQNYVKTTCLDLRENLFIGTFEDGLLKLNLKTGQYIRITNPSVFSESFIFSIHSRKDGNLWIATSNGLVLFNPLTNEIIKNYKHVEGDPNSLYHNSINNVYEDKNNIVWISTQESLDEFNPDNNTFTHFTRENLKGLSHYKVTSIMEDRDGFIWIGTSSGLNKINPKTHEIIQFMPFSVKQNKISDPFINSIYQDKAGFIWISTKNGLNKYDPQLHTFVSYFKSDGLLSDNVSHINEDNSGNLWVTSALGISKINLKNKTFRNYTYQDGLNISTESFYKDKIGYFYIGGKHENFYRFYPDSIRDNLTIPEVYITDFLLSNKSVGIYPNDKYSPLQQNILTTKEIVLNYKQSDFAFEFTALNYNLPEKNRFAYKMEGFNKDWIYTDSKRRIANYTNLHRGDYVFRVKASNNDGIWNEVGTSIKIKILPAPWETNMAFAIYALIILASLYLARSIMKKQVTLKNNLRLEHLEREKERQFHQLKTRFFTNISHEFRTPLTLISGPVNQLISFARNDKSKENDLKYYHLIEKNVNRIAQLTNQLLDFRKIETETMKLELYQGDLVQFIKNTVERFEQFAESKQITLGFSTSVMSLKNAWFDPDKVEKIISNLLSNALKFTHEKGTVSVDIIHNNNSSNKIQIIIKDSGIGIAPEHINNVFDRFYQVDHASTSIFEGTGIGLSLAKEMAQLCKGDISVESTAGEGSTFIVDLPVNLESFENYSIITEIKETGHQRVIIDSISSMEEDIPTDHQLQETRKPTVLIVEDNKDLRFFIADILQASYQTEEAENGEVGLEKAFSIIPDIIVCDIMMPVKDGITFTKSLKSDQRTSHIPVILLTALSSVENQVKGLETGADDYIVKPFIPEILLLKLKNSLLYRQKVKEYFIQNINNRINQKPEINLKPKEIIINSYDEKIIHQAMEIVEQNISDSEFNVDKFASAIGMEASTLYKKLMALIEMPPGEFIRDIRMKRAAQLLSQNKISISEIAYMVGFDTPNYFSKVFKKYYNISPTDYIQQQTGNTLKS